MEHFQLLRILEAILFSASAPITEKAIRERMPEGADAPALLEELRGIYANRGVHLLRVGKGWAFRSAPDLAPHLRVENTVPRRISRAAVETLAIIAYHQPITRAEIEEMRGVALSRGTLDLLLEAGWIRPRGKRRTAGRPVTWGTSEGFLDHFGLESLDALPGVDELKAAGLLERKPGFGPLSEIREQPTAEAAETAEAGAADGEAEKEANAILDEEFAGEAENGSVERLPTPVHVEEMNASTEDVSDDSEIRDVLEGSARPMRVMPLRRVGSQGGE